MEQKKQSRVTTISVNIKALTPEDVNSAYTHTLEACSPLKVPAGYLDEAPAQIQSLFKAGCKISF